MSKKSIDAIGSPKTERWVIVMACSFVPVIAALFVPQAIRVPLVAIGGLLFIAGFVLMLRKSGEPAGNESLRRLVHSDLE
jgi:predicted histidine transporter YuiF (NhaC family)